MDYKKAFYSKLEDCYLGVKIISALKNNVAQSGFSNLLQIKRQYFEHIKAYLDKEIDKKCSEMEQKDIYNKLYTFFDSYLNESGTPFFNDTPIYKNIYAKVYSNSKDTSLFYKTQNLYYVKSDTLYVSLALMDSSEKILFDFNANEYKQNADNTKSKVFFALESIEKIENTDTLDSITLKDTQIKLENLEAKINIKVLNSKDSLLDAINIFKQNSNELSEDFLKELKKQI